ncbi:MAG: UvrD-helicase domain-containing protein [Candidatus Omnitrophica bacterium]|nr:UvrD-helicase domain-containing protein [Candidatus Omnitrophota bacterium]
MNSKKDLGLDKFPQVVVVEASAGSGKTFALAKRYLELIASPKLIKEPLSLRSILAITFTNKATIEMKERILDLLKKIALDGFLSQAEREDILNLLGLDQEKAKLIAHDIVDRIVRHYNFFQVKTIDSFINALLLGCALNIDRSSSFKIKRDYRHHLAFCLDLVIDQASSNRVILKLLEEFLDHYLFVENRKGWFPKEDILSLMHSLFTLSNKFGGLFQVYKGKGLDVIKMKRHIYQKIVELSLTLPEGINANAFRSIVGFVDKSENIFDIADIPQSLTKSNPLMNKEKVAPEDFIKRWRSIHGQLVELIELDATVAYNPYVALFHKLLEFFQVISKKEDVLFLEELNHKARLLFDQEGLTVAEAYYRLATRFRHYLIDEFQDTSILQWRNLEPMIDEALSTGGSLFYVGDKKQAIYRFRGGESGLFDEIKGKFSRYNVIPTQLTNNWRSQKAIIDFNNRIFSKDNLAKALELSGINEALSGDSGGCSEIADVFKDAFQKGRDKNCMGYVSVEHLDEKNQSERNEIMQPKIIGLLKSLSERFRYEDIAILTRNNSEVELISSWLLSEKIPVESEKTLNVIENSLIKEVICLLKFLNSPIDDLSFVGFILGEIFIKASGVSREQISQFIFELHSKRKGSGGISFYRKFAKQYPKIWKQYFEDFFQSVGFISVYELLSSIYNRFSLFANFSKQQAFFMKFFELVKQREDEYVGIGEFLDYLESAASEDLYVTITHSDSVKVLTVHKSKGLEFPVVIIPFFRIEISPETGAKGTNSYVLPGNENQDLGLVRITKTHRLFSKKLNKIYAQNYKKACIDELNNIYVALTRPKHELYIFIPNKSGPSSNKASFFIPKDLTKLGVQKEYSDLKKDITQPMIETQGQDYRNWIDVLGEKKTPKSEVINREKILEGKVIHALLAQIKNYSVRDKSLAVDEAIAIVKRDYPNIDNFAQYKNKLIKLVEDERFKDIFYSGEAKVYCEKEVVNKYGDLKRVDRLIIGEKDITIIDYKSTSSQMDKDREQVKEYLEIFSGIYSKKKLKGFIVYLDDFSLEEVKF